MRIAFLLFFVFKTIVAFSQDIENNSYNNKYYFKDNKLYTSDSAIYTGIFQQYYPGELKIEGSYKNGLKEGRFYYHNIDNQIDSIISYTSGKKNGDYIEFNSNNTVVHNIIRLEEYKNDTLIKGYYWHDSGQLTKTFLNNEIQLYSFDTSIFTIIPFIKGERVVEKNGKMSIYLKKKDLCKNIKSLLQIAKVTCEECWSADQGIIDTLILKDFTIVSYTMEGPVYDNIRTGSHGDCTWNIKSNNISDKIANYICNNYPAFLYFSEIKIIDNNNVEYNLPPIKVNIRN